MVAHSLSVPEQKLLLLIVLAERPELLGLNSLLSSSEKGDSEAGETLFCFCCWGRWGRRINRGIRLLEISFSWCCTLCSFSKLESQKKTVIFSLPLQTPVSEKSCLWALSPLWTIQQSVYVFELSSLLGLWISPVQVNRTHTHTHRYQCHPTPPSHSWLTSSLCLSTTFKLELLKGTHSAPTLIGLSFPLDSCVIPELADDFT